MVSFQTVIDFSTIPVIWLPLYLIFLSVFKIQNKRKAELDAES